MTKYIFVTGGVMSGIGKGIIIASLASLLRECGIKLTIKKMDPYLNIDSGTMNPFEHGETFVTRDGLEADLDLGHYERFTDIHTNKNSIITSGKIYMSIFGKERKGEYLGQTVQMIPHVSNEIKAFVQRDNDKYDVIQRDTVILICINDIKYEWNLFETYFDKDSHRYITGHSTIVKLG